jgi:hypothetical protein
MQKTVPNDQRVEQHCADVGEKRHEQEIGEGRVRFAQDGVESRAIAFGMSSRWYRT